MRLKAQKTLTMNLVQFHQLGAKRKLKKARQFFVNFCKMSCLIKRPGFLKFMPCAELEKVFKRIRQNNIFIFQLEFAFLFRNARLRIKHERLVIVIGRMRK